MTPPGAPTALPRVHRPELSVLVPLHGRGDLAIRAVASVIAHTPPCYEVIVVDNASPDGAADALELAFDGLRLVRSPLNLGFAAGVDLAALHATGRYVLLLNTDVEVEPGWLPPLLEVMGDDAVGAVTPLLLTGAAEIAELGSVVFADGSTAPIPAGHGPGPPHRRAVPYASAACLLLRRRDLCAIGGLDPIYGRGYYEDVELAYDLGALGRSIVCEPRSRARHLGGGSSDRARAVQLLLANRELFQRRWGPTVARLPAPDAPGALWRAAATAVDRLLFIDDRVPHTDRGSGDPRMAMLLAHVADRHPHAEVTVLATDPSRADEYAPALAARGVQVAAVGADGPERWLCRHRGHYSAVVISRTHNVARFGAVVERTQPQAIRVVDVEAVASTRLASIAAGGEGLPAADAAALAPRARAEAAAEAEAWWWADEVMCVSEEEATIVRRTVPHRQPVVVGGVPAAVDDPPRPRAERSGLVFFGGFLGGESSPNTHAVHHLLDAIMPLLWRWDPGLTLTVAGADPPPSVEARAGDRVQLRGRVPRPTDALQPHLVHLVPLRVGAGLKLRLLDSMASGTPFVTTPVGAQGLDLGPWHRHLVADGARGLASRTRALLEQPDLWQAVHDDLVARVQRDHGAERFQRSLDGLMNRLGLVGAT